METQSTHALSQIYRPTVTRELMEEAVDSLKAACAAADVRCGIQGEHGKPFPLTVDHAAKQAKR